MIILTIGFFLFTPKNHNLIHVGKTKENFALNQMPPIIHIIFDELSSPKYLPAELSGGINYSTMVSKLLEAQNYTLFPEAFSRSSLAPVETEPKTTSSAARPPTAAASRSTRASSRTGASASSPRASASSPPARTRWRCSAGCRRRRRCWRRR